MSESLEYQQKKKDYEEEAEKRFQGRVNQREGTAESLKVKGALETAEPERREIRESLINPVDGLAFERIIGDTDLVDINYFDLGINSARSVCRIQVRSETGTMLGMGTGFMVSPSLLLTNHHVLDSLDHCRRSLADFNFEDDIDFTPKPIKTFPLTPDRLFYTSEELDFTLIAVRPQALDGTALSNFGFLRLLSASGKVLKGECVSIIQHPNGGTKEACLRENKVVDLPDDFIHYLTDTNPGSSGSPVFNDQWIVAALHHAGVKKRDDQGRVLTKDGKVFDPATMGEEEIAWVANEGVRISKLIQNLQKNLPSFTEEQKDLVNELLTGVAMEAGRPALTMEIVTPDLEFYAKSTGYDPNFLAKPVPLPTVSPELQNDLAPLLTGSGNELKYTHFSILMRKSRCLALYTAVNIDGKQHVNIPRGKDKWLYDPRIDKSFQYGPDLYAHNELDCGHLVRRQDPDWGADAAQADTETFHFTNCSPQHHKFNSGSWEQLEDYILKNASKYGMKVTVFTGPVFRDDDMLYRGSFRIPAEFWKVVAIVNDDGKLSATAYLQTQKNLLPELEFAYGQYKTYQIPVAKIESLTKLNFGELRNFDPMEGLEAAMTTLVIEKPGDIRL
jgi:endonuclease G, mitochondrial